MRPMRRLSKFNLKLDLLLNGMLVFSHWQKPKTTLKTKFQPYLWSIYSSSAAAFFNRAILLRINNRLGFARASQKSWPELFISWHSILGRTIYLTNHTVINIPSISDAKCFCPTPCFWLSFISSHKCSAFDHLPTSPPNYKHVYGLFLNGLPPSDVSEKDENIVTRVA